MIGRFDSNENKYYAGETSNGTCFKDMQAFFDIDKICYIPESAFFGMDIGLEADTAKGEGYTGEELLEMCDHNLFTALKCLEMSSWESPGCYIEQMEDKGYRICDNCGGEIDLESDDKECKTCMCYLKEEDGDFKTYHKTRPYYKNLNVDVEGKDLLHIDKTIYIDCNKRKYDFAKIASICSDSKLCKEEYYTPTYKGKIRPIILAHMVFYYIKGERVEELLEQMENNLSKYNIF